MTEPARPGSQSTSGRLLRFGAVGAVGFIVDGGLLYGLVASGLLGSLTARVVSFPTAVLTTWMLNRRFTFHDRGPAWPSPLNH